MKNKRLIISFLIISVLLFGSFSIKARADSGWDSSYDSGGWDSGGWDSSSWDSSSSWSSSSGSSHYSGNVSPYFTYYLLFVFIFIIVIVSLSKKNTSNGVSAQNYYYIDLPDDELNSYGINKEAFKEMVFNKYVDIQKSWMDFDYKSLQKNLTDELYNTYVMQLDALKIKNQKNIMSDFELLDCKIIEIKKENGLLNINVFLRVAMYDYVVDQDNNVLRGNNNHRIDIAYVITRGKSSDDISDTYCPNCGAKVNIVASSKCDYCGSSIIVDAKDYVMSKKTCIGQRRL